MRDRLVRPAEVFPPGEYIRDWCTEDGMSEDEFRQRLGLLPDEWDQLMDGTFRLDLRRCELLGAICGTSAVLWAHLEQSWRRGPASTT